MLYILTFFIFLSSFLIFYFLLSIFFKDSIIIEKRMNFLKESHLVNHDEDNHIKSFSQRIFMPLYKSLVQIFVKSTHANKAYALNKKLEKSGLIKNESIGSWLFKKIMTVIIVSATSGIITFVLTQNILKALIFIIITAFLINTMFNFNLSRKIEIRKKQILKDLPYTLDLITVSVEAGLSFDGAMARVVSNLSGELSDEFSKCLKEIRMGIQRKTALKNLSERCDVKELSMIIASIIQADELGVSLGRVLRIESANLRELRKQSAREKAMKAPVKMLFPLIFFIFPSIFIIILGPAVIKIIDVFKK